MPESICVGVRARPFNEREKKDNAELCISMNGPTTTICDKRTNTKQSFTFDASFWSHDGFVINDGYSEPEPGSKYADQKHVFDTFGKRVLDNAWDGYHCCLFAYGQTGSGKSYSMIGYGKNKGIIPVSCEEIFLRIEKNDNPAKRYEVTVSMIEIYNETVQDLLVLRKDRKDLILREHKGWGIYIEGVTKRLVASYEAITETIEEATGQRTVGATNMNPTSSRAHTVQTIEFKQVEKVDGKDMIKVSMINLIDLAGSEKASKTGASGKALKEGSMINKSLSTLGKVIEMLAEKAPGVIPYRESKLTRLLQNALGGSSKTIMICALSPASSNYEETLSTLKYADRAKKIKNNAVVNENPQGRLLRELREENEKLKKMMENLSSGAMVDIQVLNDMNKQQKDIKEVEEALAAMEVSFEERLREAEEQKEQKRRIQLAMTRGDIPMLVNLNEDMMLSGKVKCYIDTGVTKKVGCPNAKKNEQESGSDEEDDDSVTTDESDYEDGPDIQLFTEGVHYEHAMIENKDGICRINAEGPGAANTWINGISLETLLQKTPQADASKDDAISGSSGDSDKRTKEADVKSCEGVLNEMDPLAAKLPDGVKLEHGDRVVFGRSFFFFCIPSITDEQIMIVSKQVSYAKASKELLSAKRKQTIKRFMSLRRSSPSEKLKLGKPSPDDGDDGDGSDGGGDDESDDESTTSSITSNDLLNVLEKQSAELNEQKAQIKELMDKVLAQHEQLQAKDQLIQELREGGVGGVGKTPERLLGISLELSPSITLRRGIGFEDALRTISIVEANLGIMADKKRCRFKKRPQTGNYEIVS
mmetsp:Transcript_5964/g.9700  ORF Transcript_5964/g.9700 Transcript_5964/m.9700 type:complete len:818 (-) Transcript_5964:262-2715(-)